MKTALAPVIYAHGASLVVNPDPSRGQFSSLQVGLHEVLNHGRDAAMVTLVDRPPVGAATIQALHDAFEISDQNIWAVIPEFSGKHGHPYLVGREMMEAFLRVPATSIARDIEHAASGAHPVCASRRSSCCAEYQYAGRIRSTTGTLVLTDLRIARFAAVTLSSIDERCRGRNISSGHQRISRLDSPSSAARRGI